MKKYFVCTKTDAQKFKAKFEECRNEVNQRAKKGKVTSLSVVPCYFFQVFEWLQHPGVLFQQTHSVLNCGLQFRCFFCLRE